MKARKTAILRADGQTRTADRRFTKPLLYRLSYVGADFLVILARREPMRECSPNSRPHCLAQCGCFPSISWATPERLRGGSVLRRREFASGSFGTSVHREF